jgi:acetyltransferase
MDMVELISEKSLDCLLNPRSIAIVGVRGGAFDPSARNSMARRFVENLLHHGYKGHIYPINPRYEKVGDLVCYPSISAVPWHVDAALLILPKEKLAASLAECSIKGVRAITVITSGFAESGTQGKIDELELVEFAQSNKIRLLGPNCFGYLNSHGRVNLFGSASLLNRPLLTGSIGFVTQSGALAASILDRAQERGIGFSYVITTGNQADIHNVECIEYMLDDPNTQVIALFAEALGHTSRFRAAMLRSAIAGKPCVVLKTGASEVARESALAHTGSLVGDDDVYAAAFRQCGVVRVQDPDELFLTAALLARDSKIANRTDTARIAVVSMSGAMGGILADGAARHGVTMAQLSSRTSDALMAISGVSGGLNPLDAAMATWSGDFGVVGKLAGILALDENVDVVLLAISGLTYAERLVDDCAAAVRFAGKLFVPMWAADHTDLHHAIPRLAKEGVTVFCTCDSALRAISGVAQFRKFQALLTTDQAVTPVIDEARVAKARSLLSTSGSALTEHHSKQLLALYGINIPSEAVASNADEAVFEAERIGYPVALKIHSAEILHKTESGGIQLGLTDAAAIRLAYDKIFRSVNAYRPGAELGCVLVTPMAAKGLEVVVGAYQDAQFGPVLLAGMGGVLVEVLRDTVLRLAPLGRDGAFEMLGELHAASIFDGVRGQPAADRDAVAQVLVALSTLMIELGEWVREVDINPLIVHTVGMGATVADALIVLRLTETK